MSSILKVVSSAIVASLDIALCVLSYLPQCFDIRSARAYVPSPTDEPRRKFEGDVCWIGDTHVSDCCRRYYRAMVIKQEGRLHPALHYLAIDGSEEVTMVAAVANMTVARRQANALLPV
ncbi:hypothetical protein NB700_001784 [Xanthomonas sacchari]|uniref:Secreted protein n=1 Tax=Xanthomonas sacchari TaxID=56458 RepID=A0ABT3DUQ4_9XANT|nr:hypothetical protein [Xanthomonas sacchari]MCW0399228.1 hypothetical protein [Xanthomonas sacchari]